MHLVSPVFFNQSNITETKDSFRDVTKPPLTEPSHFVYVWKTALQSMLLKSCHVHYCKRQLRRLWARLIKAIHFMKLIK